MSNVTNADALIPPVRASLTVTKSSSLPVNVGCLKLMIPISLSMMLNIAESISPNLEPPEGFARVNLIVSSDSNSASLTIGIVTVLLVSPLVKLTIMGCLRLMPGSIHWWIVSIYQTIQYWMEQINCLPMLALMQKS